MATAYDTAQRFLFDENDQPLPDRWSMTGSNYGPAFFGGSGPNRIPWDYLRTTDGAIWVLFGTSNVANAEVGRLVGDTWTYWTFPAGLRSTEGQGLWGIRSDGTTVWLISFGEVTIKNEFNENIPQTQLRVRPFDGGSWPIAHVVQGVGAAGETIMMEAAAAPAQPGVLHLLWGEAGTDNGHFPHGLRRRYVFASVGAVNNQVILSDQHVPWSNPPYTSSVQFIPNSYTIGAAEIVVRSGGPLLVYNQFTRVDSSTPLAAGFDRIKVDDPYAGTRLLEYKFQDYNEHARPSQTDPIIGYPSLAGLDNAVLNIKISRPITDPETGANVRVLLVRGVGNGLVNLLPENLAGTPTYIAGNPVSGLMASSINQNFGIRAVLPDPVKPRWWAIANVEIDAPPFLLDRIEVYYFDTLCPGDTVDPDLGIEQWWGVGSSFRNTRDFYEPFGRNYEDQGAYREGEAFYAFGLHWEDPDFNSTWSTTGSVIRIPICRNCEACNGGCCQVICANLAAGPAAPEIHGDIGVSLTTTGDAVDFSFELVQWELYWGSHGNEDIEVDYRYAPIEDISTTGWETAINGALQDLPVSATPTDSGEWALEARSRDVCTGEVSPTARAAFHVILTSADADRGPLEPAPAAPDTVAAQVSSSPRIVTQP